MSAHTPTPWAIDGGDIAIGGVVCILADYCGPDYAGTQERIANAAHIVRCVNLHDELVAALDGMVRMFDAKRKAYDMNLNGMEYADARAALAKAKGGAS